MTEDFEKSAQTEPEAEFPSPFDESGASPLPEIIEVVAEEPIAPPPLPEDVIEEAVAEVEAIAPPPLPEAYPETEVMGALPPEPEPEPEPAVPTARQPITFGPPPAAAAPPPSAPTPRAVDVSPAEQAAPKKNNQTLIIVLVAVGVLLLLCCCCVVAIVVGRPVLEELMWQLGINLLTLL